MAFLNSPLVQDFAMPFLFVFALSYGMLRITQVFKDNTKVEAVISIIIAAFAVSNPSTLQFIKLVMPIAVLGMVGLFGIVFIWKIGKVMTEGEQMDWGVLAVLLMAAMLLLMTPSVWDIIPSTRWFKRADILFIGGLVVIGALFLFAHRSDNNNQGLTKGPGSENRAPPPAQEII